MQLSAADGNRFLHVRGGVDIALQRTNRRGQARSCDLLDSFESLLSELQLSCDPLVDVAFTVAILSKLFGAFPRVIVIIIRGGAWTMRCVRAGACRGVGVGRVRVCV